MSARGGTPMPLSAMQIDVLIYGALGASWDGDWHCRGFPCTAAVHGLKRRGLITTTPAVGHHLSALRTPAGAAALVAEEAKAKALAAKIAKARKS